MSQALHYLKNLKNLKISDEVLSILSDGRRVVIPNSKEELFELAIGGQGKDFFDIVYDVPGHGLIKEAWVDRRRNGLSVNCADFYMRRRDPESMVIADKNPTEKARFEERFKQDFESFRGTIFDWLKKQELILLPFYSGRREFGFASLLIAPLNAAFFAAALAEIQGMIPRDEIPPNFSVKSIIYVAPPFRHTHCKGKQVVIHNRSDVHEIFSLNLYPGPSAKKGVYGVLLTYGEKEGWITVHGSTVKVITPYDNEFVILHEGASGGGKSEMLQYPHREPDGRLLVGENVITKKRRYIPLFQGCTLRPVTDDMALCPTSLQKINGNERLVVVDSEEGWFVRVDHIKHYGVDQYLENICTNPQEPLVFLNLYSVPRATCLIWEHIEDRPGVPCPNQRVILPRRIVPDIINEPVEVNARSFGVRTPPCTRENPTYGIIGILHLLPPALAWLWRLVSPRGHANPSITDTEGMSSEGVGSYWPFATGRRVDQANLLLKQILATPRTRYTLTPNQHIGAWKVGFMSQWIAREYLSRRGSAKFRVDQLLKARCPLLGYAMNSMQIEGFFINREFLSVEAQAEVGEDGYDEGAKILKSFFDKELRRYTKEKDLDPLGLEIVECCLDNGSVEDYEKLIKFS